jgi:hypothetical protein
MTSSYEYKGSLDELVARYEPLKRIDVDISNYTSVESYHQNTLPASVERAIYRLAGIYRDRR